MGFLPSSMGGSLRAWRRMSLDRQEVESNYYYNQRTGEASWIRPDDFREPSEVCAEHRRGPAVWASPDRGQPLGLAQSSFGRSHGRRYCQGASGDARSRAVQAMRSWHRYWDDDQELWYMHNAETGESRWVLDDNEQQKADGTAASSSSSTTTMREEENETGRSLEQDNAT